VVVFVGTATCVSTLNRYVAIQIALLQPPHCHAQLYAFILYSILSLFEFLTLYHTSPLPILDPPDRQAGGDRRPDCGTHEPSTPARRSSAAAFRMRLGNADVREQGRALQASFCLIIRFLHSKSLLVQISVLIKSESYFASPHAARLERPYFTTSSPTTATWREEKTQ